MTMKTIEFYAPVEVVQEMGSDGKAVVAGTSAPVKIKGLALAETTSLNGITYVAEELDAIPGRTKLPIPLLKDHENKMDNTMGLVTGLRRTSAGLEYEATVMDPLLKEMARDGRWMFVSIGAQVDGFEERDLNGKAQVVARGIALEEISATPIPGVRQTNVRVQNSFAVAVAESVKACREIGETKMSEKETQPASSDGAAEMKGVKESLAKLTETSAKTNESLNALVAALTPKPAAVVETKTLVPEVEALKLEIAELKKNAVPARTSIIVSEIAPANTENWVVERSRNGVDLYQAQVQSKDGLAAAYKALRAGGN